MMKFLQHKPSVERRKNRNGFLFCLPWCIGFLLFFFIPLVLIPAIFVTGAILLGFRGPELCAIFLLFAAPTAVSSYPLAVSMDADPELAGQMVIFTTVCCLPTFFLWVMAMSSFGLF